MPKSNYVQSSLWQNVRKSFSNTTKNVYKENNTQNGKLVKNYLLHNFATMGILSGGAAFIISRNQILCKAKSSRMVGYRSLSDKNLKFDWNMFWHYLKPYLQYFVAAILVSSFLFASS